MNKFARQQRKGWIILPNIGESTSDMYSALPELQFFTTLEGMGLQPFLQFRNKAFNQMMLGVQKQSVVCLETCTSQHQLWTAASVDPNTAAFSTISFQSKHLHASASDEVLRLVESQGTQWKIQAVDEHHVKILAENGKHFCC